MNGSSCPGDPNLAYGAKEAGAEKVDLQLPMGGGIEDKQHDC